MDAKERQPEIQLVDLCNGSGRLWLTDGNSGFYADAAPDLLAACEAVAEFQVCDEAADWKDAYGRLTGFAVAAIAAARGDGG